MILAIDTATLQAGVALLTLDGALVASRRARVTTHSEALLTMIAEVFAEAGLRPDDLRAVACGAGPGSFTGLRIGLATAKGLCLAIGAPPIPLVLVSSLQAMARRAPSGALAVPCIDAFKGEVYAGLYRAGREPRPAAEPVEVVLAPERLRARLVEALALGPVCLLGDGVVRFPELAIEGAQCDDTAPPDPADVGRLAALRLARGEHDDLAAAVPRYVRASEVELKFGVIRDPGGD